MKLTKMLIRDIGRWEGSLGSLASDFRTAFGTATSGAAPTAHAASHDGSEWTAAKVWQSYVRSRGQFNI